MESAHPAPTELRFRPATAEDAAEVAPLLGELGYPAEPEAARRRLERLIPDPALAVLVAEHDGRVVGLATVLRMPVLHEDAPRAQLTALVVAERVRGLGIGAALVREAERCAAAMGAHKMVVTTANHRTRTHGFYEALGYEWTGRRYVRDVGGKRDPAHPGSINDPARTTHRPPDGRIGSTAPVR